MKPVTYTRQAKTRYLVALILFAISVAMILLRYFAVGDLTFGIAFSLAYQAAEANGHLTHFGRKKERD